MTYTEELSGYLIKYMDHKIAEAEAEHKRTGVMPPAPPPPVTGEATDKELGKAVRELHTELCRAHGMTAEEIIDEWNLRSPEDPW